MEVLEDLQGSFFEALPFFFCRVDLVSLCIEGKDGICFIEPTLSLTFRQVEKLIDGLDGISEAVGPVQETLY